MSHVVDRVAAGWLETNAWLTRATPHGQYAEKGDAVAMVRHCQAWSLNIAGSIATQPDLVALDTMATEAARFAVPWSILVRAEAAEAAAELAARHGLTSRVEGDIMACTSGDAVLRAGENQLRTIRKVGSDSADVYATTMADGFEVPVALFGSLMGGNVLDIPSFAGYLSGPAERPRATGFAMMSAGTVGVYNIAVVPAARRQGIGRAMTSRVLEDGFACGAEIAYLQPSQEARPLYESMGFRHIDTWVSFIAPLPPQRGDRDK